MENDIVEEVTEEHEEELIGCVAYAGTYSCVCVCVCVCVCLWEFHNLLDRDRGNICHRAWVNFSSLSEVG